MMYVGLRGRKLLGLLLILICARMGAQESAGQPFVTTPEVVTVPAPEAMTVAPSGPTPTSPDVINAPAPLYAGPQPNPVAPSSKELTPQERTSPDESIVVPASVPGGLVRPAQSNASVAGPASASIQEPISSPLPEASKTQPTSALVPAASSRLVPGISSMPASVTPASVAVPTPAIVPVAAPMVTPEVAPTSFPNVSPLREPISASESTSTSEQMPGAESKPLPELPASEPAVQPKKALAQMETNVLPAKQLEPVEGPGEIAIEEEELVGIDTVDLESPQGNWLFKRLWWERAEEKYEEIRALEAHILELRMPFFMKRTDVDRTVLDPFYLNIAQDRGALEILLADIAEFLAQEAQEEPLDEQERGVRDLLKAQSETLAQLQKNIQAVLSFDHELDSAIGTLMEQLNRVSEYEQEAWAFFKEIGRVLDDKKAREYVLKMKNIHRNIKEIEEYIQEPFTIYFDQLIATIKDNAQAVTGAMDQLREKGIDLKEQLGQIKDQAKGAQEEPEEAPKPKVVERGFFDQWVISPISSFFGTIWNGLVAVFSWPYNMIFGEEKPAVKRPIQVEEVVVEETQEESEEPSEND